LSLLCTLTSKRFFEVIAQPAVGFELVRQFPLDRVNGAPGVAPKRNFANGQFMLWKRTSFEALGGHEAVKGELLEDMALARRLGSRAFKDTYRGGCLLAAGLVRCEMYRDWPAFIKGWKRIFTEAAHRKPKRLMKAAMLQVVTDAALVDLSLVGVLVGAIVGEPIIVALCGGGLLTAIAARVVICKQQGARLLSALTFSEGALASAWIMHTAARELRNGTQTQWGGRSYSRPVRGEHA
jgi:hypothetical protein